MVSSQKRITSIKQLFEDQQKSQLDSTNVINATQTTTSSVVTEEKNSTNIEEDPTPSPPSPSPTPSPDDNESKSHQSEDPLAERYRQLPVPEMAARPAPRKPAKPPPALLDLSVFCNNDDDVYDDAVVVMSTQNGGTARPVSTVSQISEFTEEEECARRQTMLDAENDDDEIYDDVGQQEAVDDEIYEELD
jgi:hypothetical protein